MAKLQVSLHGQILAELNLEPGQEYYAGRGSQSHILLENQRGISRQHIKFYQENNVWTAQLLSKFGGLVFDGQSLDTLTLQNEVRFSVPPYEFYFVEALEEISPAQTTATGELDISEESLAGNLDATVVGATPLIAYLKVNNTKIRTSEILKLAGNMWTLGRHPSCEILVNDSAVSRKHFDITKTVEGYFITDHGTSNGTKINGDKIPPNLAKKILSGDVIAIRHIEIIFEIHDSSYENQLAMAPQFNEPVLHEEDSIDSALDSHPQYSPSPLPAVYQEAEHGAAAVLRIPPVKSASFKKPNPIQIALGVLAILFIFGLMSNNKNNNASGEKEIGSRSEELSPDKKKQVVDMFNLAQNYYVDRKYVMCLSQVERLHTLVPFYSNSKELESLCKQAQELQQIEADRRRKEQARAEVQNKIKSNIDFCRGKITAQTSTDELNACLQPSLELDPENGMIIELLSQVQINEDATKDRLQKQADYARRKRDGQSIFRRAENSQRNQNLKTALKEYKRFLRGAYPGLDQEKDQASRNIASITNTLETQLKEQVQICQSSYDEANLKSAILACDKVLKENPQSNEAREVRNKALSQLRREMKSLYEDSRIEESLGNIEAAKQKWQKIVEKSVPQDDYYNKAKKNLKKYGIGM